MYSYENLCKINIELVKEQKFVVNFNEFQISSCNNYFACAIFYNCSLFCIKLNLIKNMLWVVYSSHQLAEEHEFNSYLGKEL
jgi:hypothetical protein